MKKIYTFIVALMISGSSLYAQTPVLCENFNAYDSLTANANYNGWTLNYYSQFSYYTSTFSSGPSGPNSYKFGIDSATAITPNISGATHINFWMRGNSTDALSAFSIYETNNGTTWNLIQTLNPISTTPGFVQYALTAGTTQVKFYYHKSVGNVAFDDFCATIGAVNVGINDNELNSEPINVFPTPTEGVVNITFAEAPSKNPVVKVMNVLGSMVNGVELKKSATNKYTVDLTGKQSGFYFIMIQTDKGSFTRRITLN